VKSGVHNIASEIISFFGHFDEKFSPPFGTSGGVPESSRLWLRNARETFPISISVPEILAKQVAFLGFEPQDLHGNLS
jgi:hypothetical protein